MEMLVATAIMALVFAGVGTSFVAVIRMSRTAMAEAELSVRMRELREKLLFHALPPHDGKVWAGLLSGEKGIEAGIKIRTDVEGYDLTTGGAVAKTVELVCHQGGGNFINDADRLNDNPDHPWLASSGLPMLPATDVFDSTVQETKALYAINLEGRVEFERDADTVVRRERIVVPLFGREQAENTGNVFHD